MLEVPPGKEENRFLFREDCGAVLIHRHVDGILERNSIYLQVKLGKAEFLWRWAVSWTPGIHWYFHGTKEAETAHDLKLGGFRVSASIVLWNSELGD